LIGKTAAEPGEDTVATRYVYDGNQIVLAFVDGDPAHRYLWGPQVDQLLAQENVGDTVTWTLGDHQNTVRDVFEANGDFVNHIAYDSFGNVIASTDLLGGQGTPATNFLYTGRLFDFDTQLQNNWNRWYDSTLGKWISEDPIGFSAGDGNLGRYVGNGFLVEFRG